MRSDYFYKAGSLHPDVSLEIAGRLFRLRCDKNVSLQYVVRQCKIPLKKIDELECGIGSLDFADVAKLLDFYGAQLEMDISCFPDLPAERYGKYFDERYACEKE